MSDNDKDGARTHMQHERRTMIKGSVLAAAALGLGAGSRDLMAADAVPTFDDSAQRLLSGGAWDDFCEMLRRAGRVIEEFGDDVTPLDRVEWYRYLSRLARSGLARFVENDPARPSFESSAAAWRVSINVTNPDQDHLVCPIDPQYEYVISGDRGTAPYFIVAAWNWLEPEDPGARNWSDKGVAGLKEFNPSVQRTTAFIQSDALQFDADGKFELHLSQRKQQGNWLKLTPDTRGLLLRVVFHDRSKEIPATLYIRRVGDTKSAPIDASELSAGFARAAQEVMGRAEFARAWWQDELGKRPNQLQYSRQLYLANGGVPDRHFAFAIWQKAKNEALVIQFTPPDCEYWIFQLCNIWQENLDNYEEGQGYVTKFNARYEDDGSVRLVIADEDPKIGGNWVDSYQHTGGIMGLRLIKTPTVAQVTLHRLPLAPLREQGWRALQSVPALVSGELVP